MSRIRLLLTTSPIDEIESRRLLKRLRRRFDKVQLVLVTRLPAGNRFQSPSASDRSALTARQTEILREMAVGRGMKEIGRKLGISPKTVETHRQNLMKRLGIHHLPGLVRYALRSGVLPMAWLMEGASTGPNEHSVHRQS